MKNPIKKIVLLLITGGTVSGILAQEVRSKIGNSPTVINASATLELESTTKGFLPPRMSMTARDAIVKPIPTSLIVWCTDCNRAINPASGQLCIWIDSSWVPVMMNTGFNLTTNSAIITGNSATVKGTLVSVLNVLPTETGVVYTEILNNDYQTLPVLDTSGNANALNNTYKVATGTPVTTAGNEISVTIPTLSTRTSGTKAYYFRTYAKSPFGISYGNTLIYNVALPTISTPVVNNGNTTNPTFAGTLTVNAGTPPNTIIEYGYYSGTTANTTTNKVILSTTAKGTAALTALKTTLSSKSFTADSTIDLAVSDYNVTSLSNTYFRYYVTVNGQTQYSDEINFTPNADPITGSTAVAKLISIDPIKIKAGENTTRTTTVVFDVSKTGSYNLVATDPSTGNTTGLSISSNTGNFTNLGEQGLTFTISGLAKTSLDGNSFAVSGGVTINTGKILLDDTITGTITVGSSNALCGPSDQTTVKPVFSPKTGKVWMDRNLGASQVAISSDDYKAFGCLYQWGRGNDGHASINWTSATAGTPANGTTSTQATINNPGNLFVIGSSQLDWLSGINTNWQGDDGGTNNPCPFGYRVPTYTEFANEKTAYGITNTATAYGSDLKFPKNRIREYYTSGSIIDSRAFYWTSTMGTNNTSSDFTFDDGGADDNDANVHAFGFGVRCIRK